MSHAKEVPLYLHRETREVVVKVEDNMQQEKTTYYINKEGTTPPQTFEDCLEKWLNEELQIIPTQPTNQLWPLNYPQRPHKKEVPIK